MKTRRRGLLLVILVLVLGGGGFLLRPNATVTPVPTTTVSSRLVDSALPAVGTAPIPLHEAELDEDFRAAPRLADSPSQGQVGSPGFPRDPAEMAARLARFRAEAATTLKARTALTDEQITALLDAHQRYRSAGRDLWRSHRQEDRNVLRGLMEEAKKQHLNEVQPMIGPEALPIYRAWLEEQEARFRRRFQRPSGSG